MITRDPGQIEIAVDQVTGRDAYIPISKDAFQEVCPHPTLAILVSAEDADEAVAGLREAWEQAGNPSPDGLVVFIRSTTLTMDGLARINAALPQAERIRKGLDYSRPGGPKIEIRIIATV